jgi:hypothetical protein
MPTYRRGVTLEDVLTEAAGTAPLRRAMLWCFELRHPTLAAPFRFVNNRVAFNARLEASAPVDAGLWVEFLPLPLGLQAPEISDASGSPEMGMSASNVAGVLGQALRAARGSMDPWYCTERAYASDSPSAPARVPTVTYILTGSEIAALQASIKASYGDPGGFNVPRLTFRREEYSGLA